ncbi:hypothetical protein NMD1_03680 [Novosphingobium sp. MD-1]|nr:hypothetical protein NMD1_03680 [Novosphingobium sp. MD-1]
MGDSGNRDHDPDALAYCQRAAKRLTVINGGQCLESHNSAQKNAMMVAQDHTRTSGACFRFPRCHEG